MKESLRPPIERSGGLYRCSMRNLSFVPVYSRIQHLAPVMNPFGIASDLVQLWSGIPCWIIRFTSGLQPSSVALSRMNVVRASCALFQKMPAQRGFTDVRRIHRTKTDFLLYRILWITLERSMKPALQ